jgi:hypothetical protein
MINSFWCVNSQNVNRGAANRRPSFKHDPTPPEMFAPLVDSRVKERNELISRRIMTGDVWAFGCVAVSARERKIVGPAHPVMFNRANVVDLVGQAGIGLCELTVFARVPSAKADERSQFRCHAALRESSVKRALAWSRSNSWPTRKYFSSSTR